MAVLPIPVGFLVWFALSYLASAASIPSTSSDRPIEFGRRDPFGAGRFLPRDVSGNGNTVAGQTFDYIIVGGGLAGLTVANRISEDGQFTVLVIEAGGDIYGGSNQASFLTPSANLYQSTLGTDADWQWQTTSQSNLNGRTLPWPRGKVLGGSSSVNGLYMVRASQIEHDAWGSLIGDQERWGWNAMLAAMKKSENFAEPTQQVRQTVPSLKWNLDSHGRDGPVHTGWPATTYPGVEAFLQGCSQTGTPITEDPDNGQSWGAFYATSAIDPSNWQRSSSRTAYLNGADQRNNLNVLVGHQVTRVLTNGTEADGGVTATGVQYAQYSGAAVREVYARREVILSGGAINSPVILQHSGIGDAQQLQDLGIDIIVDLPGVGHNVQDHLAAAVVFAPASGAQLPPSSVTGDARQDSYVNAAIAYVNTSTLFGFEESERLVNELKANLNTTIGGMNAREEVKEAYRVTTTTQLNDVFATQVGPIELLFAYAFGSLQIQVALQHPLSRGSILVSSTNPFNSPTIDAGYLSESADLQLLREGFKLARAIGQTEAMSGQVSTELTPGSGTNSNNAWDTYIRNSVGTEYHPSSSCSMLPRQAGGVVDAKMLVYGTKNLRVIDASVPPLAVSAHLMTITYGLAEIGSEIIIEARAPPPPSTQNNSNNNTATSNNNSGNSAGGSSTSAAVMLTMHAKPSIICLLASLAMLALY